MAFVCDLKSQDHQKPADDGEDLEDGEIEDDDDDNDIPAADMAQFDADGPILPAFVQAPVVTEAVAHKSSEKASKDARKERKSSRHEKKHMTEAEKSVLYLHKMERLDREKREKYRREQVHNRRRGGSISPTPSDSHASTNNNPDRNTNSDDAADEDFATSLQRVLQSVLKKDKSAQAQAAVAAVNQQGTVSTSVTAAAPPIADSTGVDINMGGAQGDEGDGTVDTTKRVARRRKRERKKAVKRARLEAVLTAALSSDGPQLEVNDSNESTNINGGSPNHASRKIDTQDALVNASDYSVSSDDEHDRHDRKNRDRRCNRRQKRRYRSVDKESGAGGTPTKVKKGDTKLGLCLSYIQGKCMNRDCPYSHEYSPHMKMELCKFYLMECCAKGDKCYYLHSEFPCKYYHTGLPCIDGDKCKFNHGKPLSDSFKSILCKHIETAPKEILGDFPRFNREDAMNMIAITQKKLEEKYGEKKESKDGDKNDDKRDAKRNRPSRWQDKDKGLEQSGSVVNLSFLHDKDQDMRFVSNNGDIDMRTLPTTTNTQPTHTIPLPNTINTATPPPNITLAQSKHHQPQLSPPLPLGKNAPAVNPAASTSNGGSNVGAHQGSPSAALLHQLGVANPAAAALLLAGAQSEHARVAAVAALLQGAVRSQQVQLLAGAPIVAASVNVTAPNQPPPLPLTMQIPPPQLNTNAILFSTPPPSILNTPPPTIRPAHINQPPNHQQHTVTSSPLIKTTRNTSMMDHHPSLVPNAPPPTPSAIADLTVAVVAQEDGAKKGDLKRVRENVVEKDVGEVQMDTSGIGDDGVLDIERYKREAGIGRKEVELESVEEEKLEMDEEEEDKCSSLKIDYDPPSDEPLKPDPTIAIAPIKPELPNLPRAQMDLFLRIQSQQAKSDKSPSVTNLTDQSSALISDTSSNMDISASSLNTATNKDTTIISNDVDPTSSIDWYSDDDDDDDDDDNKLTIGEDAEYDDIITKSVNEVPKSSGEGKKEVVVLEEVAPVAQIVEKLGDLSKIDISAEVTKLLTSFGSGAIAKDEKSSSPSSSTKPSSSYTAPSDPRTGSKSPRSSTDPRLTADHSHHRHHRHHHHHHHHHNHHNRGNDPPSNSPQATSSSSPSQSSASGGSSGRTDPRRRRSSAESSDSGKSSGGGGRTPVPSIYDQATASFRMSNRDLDLRLSDAGATVVDSDLRTKLADVDLRSVSQGGRPDIDLRATMPQQLSLPLQFKAAMAGYTPATEIDSSYHASYVWRIYEVDVPRPDYSGLRLTEAEARSTGDPRLEKIFRLAVGCSAGDLKLDDNKEKTEFTIDESPASPARESPAAKPTTPRPDPRRRKPIEEPPINNDPTQLTYAQQLSLLQTSNFYQNLTSNLKLNLNHELSIRMQQQQQLPSTQRLHPLQQHQANANSNDPVMGAVLHSLGLTGGNSLQQQQHQQQQITMHLQQYGAMGLMQQLGVTGAQGMTGGGSGAGPPTGQQGLLGAAPGVPHDFGGPIQPPFTGGPPNHLPIRNNNNNNNPGGNFNNNSPNDNYEQYEDEDSYNNCYNSNNNNNNNNNMMMGGGGGRNNHRGGFRDNRNNRRGGNSGAQGLNRNFGRNNRNNFRNRNRNMGNNQNRGGLVD